MMLRNTKSILSAVTLVNTALMLTAEVSAFTTPNLPVIRRLRSRGVGRSVATEPNLEIEEISTILLKYEEEVEIPSKKSKSIEALEKLLARQKVEVAETERLLERFEASELCNIHDMCEDADFDDSLSVASSIVAGADYGFQSRSEGATFDQLKGGQQGFHGPPANVAALGSQQFMRNLNAIKGEYQDEQSIDLTNEQKILQSKLKQLTLNSTAIWERETADGPIEAPLIIKVPYLVLCYLLDTVFEGRYTPSRFFLLETVARMPYFSYIAMLHLYETMGFWRRSADIKRIHFAEEMNEFRHLLIMESLGGDQTWWVRFVAQHSALAYYIALCFLWAISPTLSYNFSELLETHAVNTYSQFLDENEELLKELPPSLAAVEYYAFGVSDPFYAEIQTTAVSSGKEVRRPGEELNSLYDVFSAICDDEQDHVNTMTACMDPDVAVNSPSLEKRVLMGIATASVAGYSLGTGDIIDPTSILGDLPGATGLEGVLEEAAEAVASSGVDDSSLSSMSDLLMDGGLFGGLSAAVQNAFAEQDQVIEAGTEAIGQVFEQVLEILTRVL